MMTIMVKTAGKGLANKQDRTQEEDQMLEMMLHGGKYVDEKNEFTKKSYQENYEKQQKYS